MNGNVYTLFSLIVACALAVPNVQAAKRPAAAPETQAGEVATKSAVSAAHNALMAILATDPKILAEEEMAGSGYKHDKNWKPAAAWFHEYSNQEHNTWVYNPYKREISTRNADGEFQTQVPGLVTERNAERQYAIAQAKEHIQALAVRAARAGAPRNGTYDHKWVHDENTVSLLRITGTRYNINIDDATTIGDIKGILLKNHSISLEENPRVVVQDRHDRSISKQALDSDLVKELMDDYDTTTFHLILRCRPAADR